MNSYLNTISTVESNNPYNINLGPNIRIKALNKLGCRFASFALANSILHFLKPKKFKSHI